MEFATTRGTGLFAPQDLQLGRGGPADDSATRVTRGHVGRGGAVLAAQSGRYTETGDLAQSRGILPSAPETAHTGSCRRVRTHCPALAWLVATQSSHTDTAGICAGWHDPHAAPCTRSGEGVPALPQSVRRIALAYHSTGGVTRRTDRLGTAPALGATSRSTRHRRASVSLTRLFRNCPSNLSCWETGTLACLPSLGRPRNANTMSCYA